MDTSGRNPNIIVTVRVRPENREEANSREYRSIVKCCDEQLLVFDPADPNKTAKSGPGQHRAKDLKFGFDRVLDPYASQYEVFQHTTKHLIGELLNGYNCTCFAYGATGAGKTFTMIGNKDSPGVMVLTMKELFAAMNNTKDEKQYDVSISYLEIYNETIRDLLQKQSKPLELRETGDGVQVAGLSLHKPSSAEEVLLLLEQGNSRRCQSATGANAQSSRSHGVLQIVVEQRDRAGGTSSTVKVGKLALIDLAGSERASRTKNQGKQLVEGANINKSLLALGNCINALGQDYKEGKYVPYRNSKLTRLLKDSLGGNCKTVMIANVSPSSMHYEDTYNTLNYANRAKNIKTKAYSNQMHVQTHVSLYRNVIEELRREIEELRGKLRDHERGGQNARQQGTLAERSATEDFRVDINQAIQDRVAVQDRLAEVLEKEKKNSEDQVKIQEQLQDWEIESTLHVAKVQTPQHIKALRFTLEGLTRSEADNAEVKQALLKRLDRNVEDTKRLHGQLASRVTVESSRKSLDRDMVVHWMEMDKLAKDVELRKQQQTINSLQRNLQRAMHMLEVQHKVLKDNNLLTWAIATRFESLVGTPKSRKGTLRSPRGVGSPLPIKMSPLRSIYPINAIIQREPSSPSVKPPQLDDEPPALLETQENSPANIVTHGSGAPPYKREFVSKIPKPTSYAGVVAVKPLPVSAQPSNTRKTAGAIGGGIRGNAVRVRKTPKKSVLRQGAGRGAQAGKQTPASATKSLRTPEIQSRLMQPTTSSAQKNRRYPVAVVTPSSPGVAPPRSNYGQLPPKILSFHDDKSGTTHTPQYAIAPDGAFPAQPPPPSATSGGIAAAFKAVRFN